jgi:hypothetical protein
MLLRRSKMKDYQPLSRSQFGLPEEKNRPDGMEIISTWALWLIVFYLVLHVAVAYWR